MNETFRQHVEALHPAYERLIASTPFKFADLAGQSISRTRRLPPDRRRAPTLCRTQRQHPQAPPEPLQDRRHASPGCVCVQARQGRLSFDAQKARLRAMYIRVVAEADGNRQALLEMYAAIALATPYNDFNNH